MLSEIRRMKLRNVLQRSRFSQSGCCQDCQRSSQRSRKQWRCKRKPNTAEVTDTRRTKSIWHEKQPDCNSVEQHPSVQNPGTQAQSKQKCTREINKHVSDGVYMHPVENKCDVEAKDFSKFEGGFPDVKDTLQRSLQSLRKRYPSTLHSCRKKSAHTELEQRQGSAHQ